MINTNMLEQKLDALRIPGNVVKVEENAFFTEIHVNFRIDVPFGKIRTKIKDLEILFDSRIELDNQNGLVVLKIAKKQRDIIWSSEFIKEIANGTTGQELPIIIGESATGEKVFFDLVKMPHLLVGGATGSGKSVFIHNCILSTIYNAKSSLILVDVKKVEFGIYEGISCLANEICYDTTSTIKMLRNLCAEMDKRYDIFKINHCRSIQEYRAKGYSMQYITLVIDELADLMMKNKRIEDYLVRLAQLGRASGIHLILATQRPDSEVLSGLIRANVPSRICFSVQKSMDSRIILDMVGGENLNGQGDGLFLPIGAKNVIRFQAPYTSTEALMKIVEMVS